MTLTHNCNNAFADSSASIPLHNGLRHVQICACTLTFALSLYSPFGYRLIDEMNRLGILVDLSHTSDATAVQAFDYSKAPVIWSHSSARAIHDVPRNVPDDIIQLLGTGPGKKDGIIMVSPACGFPVSMISNLPRHLKGKFCV